jgi:hypothetical protein
LSTKSTLFISCEVQVEVEVSMQVQVQMQMIDVTISNTSDELPTKEGTRIISKPRTVLLKGGDDIMTTISAPTTIVVVNSINPIQIQFGTLCFGVEILSREMMTTL